MFQIIYPFETYTVFGEQCIRLFDKIPQKSAQAPLKYKFECNYIFSESACTYQRFDGYEFKIFV